MTAPRHKGRRPRSSLARRTAPFAIPAACLGVVLSAGVGVAVWPHPSGDPSADSSAARTPTRDLGRTDLPTAASRDQGPGVSRSAQRPSLAKANDPVGRSGVQTVEVPEASGHRYATADLNLWSGPGEGSELVDVIPAGTKVAITGTEQHGFAEVIQDGMPRWVHATYLSKEDPATATSTTPTTPSSPTPSTASTSPSAPSGVSSAACASGSDVESGLTPDAVRVHRAVCAAFPQITTYGGLRPGDPGEHGTGQALDIMVSDKALGDEIAAYVIDHRTELGVSEVLWWQRIWTVQRMSEGWRTFPDRGSPTANHMDHVHVTVYGDSGTS